MSSPPPQDRARSSATWKVVDGPEEWVSTADDWQLGCVEHDGVHVAEQGVELGLDPHDCVEAAPLFPLSEQFTDAGE